MSGSAVTETTGEAVAVREFFDHLDGRSAEVLLPVTSGAYELDIVGAGRWYVAVRAGSVRVSEVPVEADCAISCSAADFAQFVAGKQNVVTAFLQGRVSGSGDFAMALGFRRLLSLSR
jgi:predicted lipid carrier protein YhbT